MGDHFERKCRDHEYKVNQWCDFCFWMNTWIWSTTILGQTEVHWTETKSCTSTDVGIQGLDFQIVNWNNKSVL